MPLIEPVVQYGILGIFTYVIVWGTLFGFPRWMESHDAQIIESTNLVKHVMAECVGERKEAAERFERMLDNLRESYEKIVEADRVSRHNQSQNFHIMLAEVIEKTKKQ